MSLYCTYNDKEQKERGGQKSFFLLLLLFILVCVFVIYACVLIFVYIFIHTYGGDIKESFSFSTYIFKQNISVNLLKFTDSISS